MKNPWFVGLLVIGMILFGVRWVRTERWLNERRNEEIANLIISKLVEKNQLNTPTLETEKAPATLEVTSETANVDIPQFFGGEVNAIWRPVVGPLRMLGLTGQEAIPVVRTMRPPTAEDALISPTAARRMASYELTGELRQFNKQPEDYTIEARVETVQLNGRDQLVVVDWRRRHK